MEGCNGLGDWFACLRCPSICTKMCPIEKENVIEELRQRIRLLESIEQNTFFDRSTGFRR